MKSRSGLYHHQAMQWELKGYKRKPGRPRVNWMDIVKRNLKSMGISWEEAGELAADRTQWRQRVAQCIYDAGWTEQNRTVHSNFPCDHWLADFWSWFSFTISINCIITSSFIHPYAFLCPVPLTSRVEWTLNNEFINHTRSWRAEYMNITVCKDIIMK